MSRRIHMAFILFVLVFIYVVTFSDMSMNRAARTMQQLYSLELPSNFPQGLNYEVTNRETETETPRRCDDHIRKIALKEYCKKYHREIPMNMGNVRKHIDYIMTLDEEHKTMYCALPKIGSSTWMAFLVQERLPIYVKNVNWDEVPIHEPSFHAELGIKHIQAFPKDKIMQKLNTYFKFLIVRHPFERLVSAYYDKFLRTEFGYRLHYRPFIIDHFRKGKKDKPLSYYEKKDYHLENYVKNGTEIPAKFLEGKTVDEAIDEFWAYHRPNKSSPYLVTFPEFLHFVLNVSDDKKQDHHWRSILHSCYPCDIDYDVIGKLETLEQDSDVIIDRMSGVGPLRHSSLEHLRDHKTQSSGSGGGAKDQRSSEKYPKHRHIPEFDEVDPHIVNELLKVYRGDLMAFGYSWDIEKRTAKCSLDWLGETCC